MLLSERVFSNPHICGIEVDLSAKEFASGNFDVQPFFNTNLSDSDFKKVYSSTGTVAFQETSNQGRPGISYTQNLTLKFPSMDKNRSQRIQELQQIKYISVKLSNGLALLLGRNDFFQNTRPKVGVQSNHKVTVVSVKTESIFPIAFFGNTVPYGFSYEMGISFLEAL